MEEKNNNQDLRTVEDENKNIEETGKVGTQANSNKDEGKAEKTYTQEEYNALDKKLKAKYEKKYEGIDIAKYREWQESQKTAEQKQAEKDANYQKALNELNALKNTNAVLEAGVNKEFIKFVSFEVSQMEGEFEENLSKFLKDNPKYLGQEVENKNISNGVHVQTQATNQESGVMAILKSKHPELYEK